MSRPKYRSEEKPLSSAAASAFSPFVRQFRKFTAMRIFLQLLPEELKGLAAPYDVRLGRNEDGVDLNTMFIYAASPTVATVLRQRSRRLVADVNAGLPVELLEELQIDVVNPARVEQQLNILAVSPD
ncbi:DUF721 domain-containing protein [bacterium]|nr:DUF721 domain-containing protein [bacterium]